MGRGGDGENFILLVRRKVLEWFGELAQRFTFQGVQRSHKFFLAFLRVGAERGVKKAVRPVRWWSPARFFPPEPRAFGSGDHRRTSGFHSPPPLPSACRRCGRSGQGWHALDSPRPWPAPPCLRPRPPTCAVPIRAASDCGRKQAEISSRQKLRVVFHWTKPLVIAGD